jgi:hypothetical protein
MRLNEAVPPAVKFAQLAQLPPFFGTLINGIKSRNGFGVAIIRISVKGGRE